MAKDRGPELKKEGNKFDKIFKENLQALIPVLLEQVLKKENLRLENLPQSKLQTTIEREPDFLKKMYSDEYAKGCILQAEIEGKDLKDTNYRMLEYGGIMARKYKLPIEQHIIYLPKGRPKHLTGVLDVGMNKWRFHVHPIWDFDYQDFIRSENPAGVLLAILTDPRGESPSAIIRLILERLIQLRGKSLETKKFIRQLEILSDLRKLQEETTKIIDSMSFEYDITKDVRFRQGKAMGIEQGKEIGLEEGKEIGKYQSIINITEKGFDRDMIAEMLSLPPDFVAKIQKQLAHKTEIIRLCKTEKLESQVIAKKLKLEPLFVKALLEFEK